MRAPQEPLAWPAAHAELPNTKRNEVEIAAECRVNLLCRRDPAPLANGASSVEQVDADD